MPGAVKARQNPGPKPFEPTADQRRSVEEMVAGGIKQDAIARAMGISDVTLRKHFGDELENGANRINNLVVRKLKELMEKGDFQALKWWSQSRMGWTDKSTLVVEAPPQMTVNIKLMGSEAPPPRSVTTIQGQSGEPDGRALARRNVELLG